MTAVPASPATAPRSAARPSMPCPLPGEGGGNRRSAGEGLGGVQTGEGVEVAQHAGELVRGPRLAAVAAVLTEADQAQRAARLVLGDGEVPGDRVPVAGAGLGAQAQTPTGDDHGAAVVPDLADLEDRRLTTPTHWEPPPSTVPFRVGPGVRCASAPQRRHRRITPCT